MQVLDSLIDGPLQLGNRREGDELIGMIVRYLRTGDEPSPRTDAQRMALAMVRPVLEKSRARIAAGSRGGSGTASKSASKSTSKAESKRESKADGDMGSEQTSKLDSKPASKTESDIYSSSSLPLPGSPSEEEGCGEEDGAIPYAEVVASLNEAAGTSYRPSSRKTRQLIRARWSEGFRLNDFETVIATMAAAWRDDPKMSAYLRPETLFGTKFESYLNRSTPRREGAHGDPFAAY